MAVQRHLAVEPNVLVWARESARLGVDEAAARIGVSASRIDQWERGTHQPTIIQLRKAAAAYNRPLAALFMPVPVQDETVFDVPDFRRPESEGDESAILRRAILRARRQQDALHEAHDDLGELPFPVLQSVEVDSDDAERSGALVRQQLALDELPARLWSKPAELLRELVSRVESRGYLIIQVQRVPIAEMRGFSIADDLAPVIALNGSDWPRGKVFTLLHELAHLGLRSGALCDLSRVGASPEERFCDQVAAATLMPARQFRAETRRRDVSSRSYDDLRGLGDRFGSSAEAALLRMVNLRLASWDDYTLMRAEFRSAYELFKRDEKDARAGKDSPIYYQLKVRDLGRPFIASMLRAHNEGVLSSRDTAHLLDVSYDKIPKLLERIRTDEVLV
ncbi:XRE family transcriptional regulator [Curtobacterium sp. VKM Ac-2887]|uniref:XRE family transcriptional regulator n=1 Tax=Curtobacterium sp. VKM Ac-2887 TaxID=2783819 RepID=UPI001E3A4CD2|nr:XRE family transcriptional regulator [Curtobacterium sp. VKM Ac-2887]